jgi:hypothetical protein
MDRLDAWNVLNRLRDDDCFPDVPTDMPPDDSIDAAVQQPIAKLREHFHGEVPDWAKQRPPIDQQSGPVVIRLSREVSKEELKQVQREVWDFAAGLEVRWKRARRTPAGRPVRGFNILRFGRSAGHSNWPPSPLQPVGSSGGAPLEPFTTDWRHRLRLTGPGLVVETAKISWVRLKDAAKGVARLHAFVV